MNTHKILIITDWYFPGHKAGGPVQSVHNLAQFLSKNMEVRVVTRITDLNSDVPYEGVEPNTWKLLSDNHYAIYLNQSGIRSGMIKSIVKEYKYNYILINGLFSFEFSIKPAFYALVLQHKKTFIAVRGMLHRSALSVKPLKKQLFLAFARGFGLYKNATMLASSEEEKKEIELSLPKHTIAFAPNIPVYPSEFIPQKKEGSNKFTVLCLGRISPEKNPIALVKALPNINAPICVVFAGAEGDENYSRAFHEAVRQLPANVEVVFKGNLPHSEVRDVLEISDTMVLPSLGENFGHAIAESLAASVPVVIGNNTPWHFSPENIGGIEVDPQDHEAIADAIRFFMAMDPEAMLAWRKAANQRALTYFQDNDFAKIYANLFS